MLFHDLGLADSILDPILLAAPRLTSGPPMRNFVFAFETQLGAGRAVRPGFIAFLASEPTGEAAWLGLWSALNQERYWGKMHAS